MTASPERLGEGPYTWKDACHRIGEAFGLTGPANYYDMSEREWITWALGAWEKAVKAAVAAETERCCKEVCSACRRGEPLVSSNGEEGHFFRGVESMFNKCDAAGLRSNSETGKGEEK